MVQTVWLLGRDAHAKHSDGPRTLTGLLADGEFDGALEDLTPAMARNLLAGRPVMQGIGDPGDGDSLDGTLRAGRAAAAGAARAMGHSNLGDEGRAGGAEAEVRTRLAPNDLIKDVLTDGDRVDVILCHAPPVDADGTLTSSDFHCDAFERGRMAEFRRDVRREEMDLQQDSEEERERAKAAKREVFAERLFDMHVGDSDAGAAAAMFETDWAQLHHAMGMLLEGDETRVVNAAREHFVAMRDVFRFYSNLFGTGTTTGNSFAMDQNEFMTIVLNSEYDLHGVNAAGVFALVCKGERTLISDPSVRMTRAQFLDALLVLAGEVNGTIIAKLYGRGAAVEPSISAEAAREVLEQVVVPTAQGAMTSTTVRGYLRQADTIDVLFPCMDEVRSFFDEFADSVEDPDEDALAEARTKRAIGLDAEDPVGERVMTMTAWFKALEAIDLLDRSFGKSRDGKSQMFQGAGEDVLTVKEASMAFFLAQSEDEGAAPDEDSDAEGLAELDFFEFIEAIAHACLAKWEDDAVPLADKIRMLVQLLHTRKDGLQEAAAEAVARTIQSTEIPLFARLGCTDALTRREEVRAGIRARRAEREAEAAKALHGAASMRQISTSANARAAARADPVTASASWSSRDRGPASRSDFSASATATGTPRAE